MPEDNNPSSKASVSAGPRLAGDDFARQNFNSLVVAQLRGLTDPKTGDLDIVKLAKLPSSVQSGMEKAMAAGQDAGRQITAAGHSGPAAAAHGHQIFLNAAMADRSVMGHMTDCVLAQSTISSRTRQVAEQTRAQLATPAPASMNVAPVLSPVEPGTRMT